MGQKNKKPQLEKAVKRLLSLVVACRSRPTELLCDNRYQILLITESACLDCSDSKYSKIGFKTLVVVFNYYFFISFFAPEKYTHFIVDLCLIMSYLKQNKK